MAAAASAIIAVCGGIHGGVDSFDLCEPCEWLAGVPLQLVHVSLELGVLFIVKHASARTVRSSFPHARSEGRWFME